MHRRKNAQRKNSSDGEMRDENKQIRLTARRKSARRKIVQTKNYGRKTAHEKMSDEIMPAKDGSDWAISHIIDDFFSFSVVVLNFQVVRGFLNIAVVS